MENDALVICNVCDSVFFSRLDTQLTGDFDPNTNSVPLSSGLVSALFGNSRIFVLASHGLLLFVQ